MAETLELGVCYLVSEFLTDALVFLRPFETAGAIAASLLESLLYGSDYIFIFVECDLRLHFQSSFPFYVLIITHFFPFVCNKVTKVAIFLKGINFSPKVDSITFL